MHPPPGSLLAVERDRDRSVVTRARAHAPLRLLCPASPGRAAWVYQANLGGGLVGRDELALTVEVGAEARLFLGSQSSGKVYRGATARTSLDAQLGDGAVAVAWPDPVACFAGAALDQRQTFRLAPTAGALIVDAWTAGRVARGERWAFDRLALSTRVEQGGAPVVHDATLVSPAHGAPGPRMADALAFATAILVGPPLADAATDLARRIAARPVTARPLVAASAWPWGAVLRLAAATTEALTALAHDLLGPVVRDVLGADPFARKW